MESRRQGGFLTLSPDGRRPSPGLGGFILFSVSSSWRQKGWTWVLQLEQKQEQE